MPDNRPKTARRQIGGGAGPIVYRRFAEWRRALPVWHRDATKRVLDFGAGYGQGAEILKGLCRYEGTDLVDRSGGAGWFVANPQDRAYDAVLLSNVLNVQESKEQLRATLRAAFNALKPGGQLVYNYPGSPRKMRLTTQQIMRYVSDEAEIHGSAHVHFVK